MTDFHAHLLPGIDDGSDSVETSIRMLDEWNRQGIERIIATPHFYADKNNSLEQFLTDRAAAFDKLIPAMDEVRLTQRIMLGAEVHFFTGMSRSSALDHLCIENTRVLLLEMPFAQWSVHMIDEVAEIKARGIIPIAAHIERYIQSQPKKLVKQFMELGIIIQSNASFFLSPKTSRQALKMLKEGNIHIVASDAHNMTTRKPDLGPAISLIERRLGSGMVAKLEQAGRVLSNETEVS